jgi:hypothetical protein
MILPNKFIKSDESVIIKMVFVLKICQQLKSVSIHELYKNTEKHFSALDEFLYSLDVLHVLDVIKVDFVTSTVTYVEEN